MNSNLKLLPAALLVAVLALAGCGGGGTPTPAPDPGPSADQQEIARLQAEIASLREALGLAPGDDAVSTIADLQAELKRLQDAKAAADKVAADAATAKMMATAKKLLTGIGVQAGNSPAGGAALSNAEDRGAAYNDVNIPTTGTAVDTRIMVGIGTDPVVALSEDKMTMVAALHGWAGKRYTRTTPASGGMYEAMVYSNVEAPTPGRKFGSAEPGTGATRAYEYTLANGILTAAEADGVGESDNAFGAAKVAFTGVTRTAGTETFKLPSPNPGSATEILIPGSYHGVAGTYMCNPADDAVGCTAAVASGGGFTLSTGDVWTFKPGNAEAQVMSGADTAYASYGWWIHKSADDLTYTASAFVDDKGTVDATAPTIAALQGTATYAGGAAGKYALHSATGGTNDAGHFTADATLEADFGDGTAGGTITGTIDNFMGADGMARDWSVELMNSNISTGGAIAGDPDDSTDTGNQATKWTIGGTAAAADGEWGGNLKKVATDGGVPTVATGTFHSIYGTAGSMVGAFGANQQ